MDEFDSLGDPTDLDIALAGESHEQVVVPEMDTTPFQSLMARSLVTASDLIEHESEPAELGFEPDNKYLSFEIASEDLWPTVARHQIWKQRFYVLSPNGTVGVVPWPGSRIIWPWERGWNADLHRASVTSLLKEPEKKKK